MRIQSTQLPRRPVQVCHEHNHVHTHVAGGFRVPEAVVDLSHAGLEIYSHHGGNESFVGGASAAISLLAAARGIQNLRDGGLEHRIEGFGNLALSAASGMVAFDTFTESHGHEAHAHSHGHGFGLIGALECVHGAAEIAVGAMEARRPDRRTIGLLRIAKGAAAVGSQAIPGAGPALQLFHLGTVCALTALDPRH